MMLRIPTGRHTFAICCLQQHPKTGLWMVITDEGLLYEGPEREARVFTQMFVVTTLQRGWKS